MHLSPQQERFVQEYLAETPYNATAAYIRAGYRATGQAARTAAARLLKQPAIQQAIADARARSASKFEITRERVLEEYAKLAFFDPRNFYNTDGSLKLPTELDDATAAALIGYEVDALVDDAPPEEELEDQPTGGKLRRKRTPKAVIGKTVKITYVKKKDALDSIVNLMGWKKEPPEKGTPDNPLHMIIHGMQGRKRALTPTATPDAEDDQ